jgi:aspartate carbamoyltransferase catalytic subunit
MSDLGAAGLPSGFLQSPHLLGIDGLSRQEIGLVLAAARSFRDVNARTLKKVPALRGQTIVSLFLEPSTRTRLSFELAAKRLSADVLTFSAAASSLVKGETLLDTVRNIEAMGPDLLVVRHAHAGAPHMLTRVTDAAIVNAGDGTHEHPTQALLDAFTLLDHLSRTPEQGLDGVTIAVIGDIAHSRVARSNLLCLKLLGAEVRVAGPPTMLPLGLEQYGVAVTSDVDEALEAIDAVMMLRIQKERAQGPLFPSEREYASVFGLTVERARRLPPHALILHPGPINRGVEIAPEVADGSRSVILDQAENGVAVRMAVLYLLAAARARRERPA